MKQAENPVTLEVLILMFLYFYFFLTNKQPPKLFLKSIEMLQKDILNPYELKKLTFVSSFHPPGRAEKWRFGHRVCISKSRHKL